MRNLSTTDKSDPEILESYFHEYPDVPKETILQATSPEPWSLV